MPLGGSPRSPAPDGGVTRFYFDSLNRRTRVEESQVAATTFTYDAVGNVTSASLRGKSVTFAYDALNRVFTKQPAGEAAVTYTYDEPAYANGIGRATTVVDSSGTTHLGYTATGQIAAYTRHIDGSNFSQQFTFDRGDRVTQLTYPNGSHADYAYTDGGNLAGLALDGAPMVSWTNYDPAGGRGSSATGMVSFRPTVTTPSVT